MGGIAPDIAAQMERDGVPLPDNIANQPTLQSNLVGYLDAYYDLDTERSHNMGLVKIPWSAITAYGEFYGFDHDELHYFVREMDDALIAQMAGEKTGGGSSSTSEVVQRPPRPD